VTAIRGAKALAVALATVAVSVACTTEGTPRPALAVEVPGSLGTWGFRPIPGEVLLVGLTPLTVRGPATLEHVSLVMETGQLELLTTRVSLLVCQDCRRRAGIGYAGYAGSSCSSGPWPPPGYGPTDELAGFAIEPGDRPSLVLYMRPGTRIARTKAIVLVYRDARQHRHELRIANERVEIGEPTSPAGDRCTDSVWFGGTRNPDAGNVRPLDPTASATP
jgi:hypothetical protein